MECINNIFYSTAAEFAVAHDISKSYVCRLCRQNKLEHIVLAGQYFIPESAESDWAARNKKRGPKK